MYELIQISEHDHYVDSPTKAGVIFLGEADAVLIDSGGDKDAGKKILRLIEAHGRRLTAIYNTHAHADHFGADRYLQEKTGCRIFANGLGCAGQCHPILEPMAFYGAYPPAELLGKFLYAPSCRTEPLTPDVLPAGWEILPLPGHCADQVGYRTADGTVFLADSLASEQTLEKYAVTYLWNAAEYLKTLEWVRTLRAPCFVPCHAPATDDIAPLVQKNVESVRAIAENILTFCREPIPFERLLRRMFEHYGIPMNLTQYALIGSTLRAYLTWLCEEGRVRYTFSDNEMLWQTGAGV